MLHDRYVIFNFSSSWISGIGALVFDILLLGIIRYHSQLICAFSNLALIYDFRFTLRPNTSRFAGITGGPVGPRYLVPVLSILIALSMIAAIALGFCINGETALQPQVYGIVTTRTDKPMNIDYDDELELHPADCSSANCTFMISTRLRVLLNTWKCGASNATSRRVYSMAHKNLTSPCAKRDVDEELSGGLCVDEINFNETKLVYHERILRKPEPPFFRCFINTISDPYPTGFEPGDPREAKFVIDKCDGEIKAMRCYRTNRIACAGWGTRRKIYGSRVFIIVIHENSKDGSLYTTYAFGNKTENVADLNKYVSNAAYLDAISMTSGLDIALLAGVLSNVTLYRRGTERNISTIDLRVAIPAFGVIATTTLLLAILTLLMWVFVVFRRRRRHYNKFCSIHEILDLSNLEKASKLTEAGLQRKVIGISQNGPHLIIAEDYEMHKCEGAKWRENDIH